MRCLGCQYDLSKLTEHRCPECGRAFNPNVRSTISRAIDRKHSRHSLIVLVIMICTYLASFVLCLLAVGYRRITPNTFEIQVDPVTLFLAAFRAIVVSLIFIPLFVIAYLGFVAIHNRWLTRRFR